MKNYPADTLVSFSVPLKNADGAQVVATGYSYRVLNEEGTELVPSTSISVTSLTKSVTVPVPADKNSLASGALGGVRVIVSTITTAAGVVDRRDRYTITPIVRLELFRNSFQTYDEALIEALQMQGLTWGRFTDADRELGLITAHYKLTKLGYRVREPSDVDRFRSVGWGEDWVIKPEAWPLMEASRWADLPVNFKTALKRAQIAEANDMLGGAVAASRRREGIMSETIGESSMMFRAGKPVDLGISTSAMAYLQGFLDFRVTLTRS